MKRFMFWILISVIWVAILVAFYSCEEEQTTIVSVDSGEGDASDGEGGGGTEVIRDTVYVHDQPCDPDTVFIDAPPCPECNDNPYEGVFYITDMQSAAFAENCGYTFITTSYQTVSIKEGMICFAGWMVDWDEASEHGGNEWADYAESDGVYYDTYVKFDIDFRGTDNLSVSLIYHIEAGYSGYAPSYVCDDEFNLIAERATVSGKSKLIRNKSLPSFIIAD